jgi:alpha-glucosidase
VLPNINDPLAKNAQDVCHGYRASKVKISPTGLTAVLSLAGPACNVYGTDVDSLGLLVEYQTDARLHVSITPSQITSHNQSWYILPEEYVPAPKQEAGTKSGSDLTFTWSNTPSFGFNVTRASTGDVLFSTTGNKLVFENQFIEIVTEMPENYNLYGLGEVIHGLRLGNNFTRTIYAADVGGKSSTAFSDPDAILTFLQTQSI